MVNASIGVSAGPLRVSQGLGCFTELLGILAVPGVVVLILFAAIFGSFFQEPMTRFEGSQTYVAGNHGEDKIKPGAWRGNTRLCKATINGQTTIATFDIRAGETVSTEFACTWERVA